MDQTKWIAYNELAWTEHILAPPEEGEEETLVYCRLISEKLKLPFITLLHIASGAGYHDYTFKKYFQVTGLDLSKGMLEEARKINPEIQYLQGDMRNFDIRQQFDAIVIPDNTIGYMTSLEDLEQTLKNVTLHLKQGGVLIILAITKEEFEENNFIYSASKGNIDITVFENNYISREHNNLYEATIIYLIRKKGKQEIYNEVHHLGLFSIEQWRNLFKKFDYIIEEFRMDHLYDHYIQSEKKYRMTMFVCTKKF